MKAFWITLALLLLTQGSSAIKQAILQAKLQHILATPVGQLNASFIPDELAPLQPYFRHLNLKEPKRVSQEVRDLACDVCIVGVEAIVDLYLLGASIETIEEAALIVCDLFNIEDHNVCQGAIANYAPQLEYILSQRRIRGNEVCAILLGPGCGHWEDVNSWTVGLPDVEKPPHQPPTPPAPGSPTKKILQLSDVHLDLSYTIGALANCDLPNCCMEYLGMAPTEEDAAQYWGDYRCDLPEWTFRQILTDIKDRHLEEIEYIVMTGDYPAHDVWIQSRENNLAHTKAVMDLVQEIFPETPVFMSMGNHESFPCNSYPTSNVDGYENPDWLYSTLAEYFSFWLPEEQLAQFRVDGFYSMNVGTDFKIIAINSNMCLNYNFFLFLGWEDPANELIWLVDELLVAEQEGRKVHLLSHIPPGNGDCLGAWGREFTKIINRFEDTVTAQFYGHTHNDEFCVFFEEDRPTNIGFITPSVTTYTGLNSAYRLYTLDAGYEGASYRVLDYETYIFNMTAANVNGVDAPFEWYKLYSPKEDLEMENLFPEDYYQLVMRMYADDALYLKYLRYFNQDGAGDYEQENPNKSPVLCPLVTTTNLDTSKCQQLLEGKP